jgi:hypothetical protein
MRAMRALPPTRLASLNLDLRYMELPAFTHSRDPELLLSFRGDIRNCCGRINASIRS